MKIIISAKYVIENLKKIADDLADGEIKGLEEGPISVEKYAREIVDLIERGKTPQGAFNFVMRREGIGPDLRNFKRKVIMRVQQLYLYPQDRTPEPGIISTQ